MKVCRFVNSRFTSNSYLLAKECEAGVWIVDPGDTNVIFAWMKAHEKTTITGVLLTHAHFDHIYGMNEIVDQYPESIVYIANVYGNDALRDPKVNGSKYTDEGPIVVSNKAQIRYYEETMQLWEGVEMQTINTPGHSPDSQCLIVEGLLFTGDTLIKDVRTVTKLRGGSVEKLEESVKLLEALKGNHIQVLPGHGEEFELDDYDLSIMSFNPLNN